MRACSHAKVTMGSFWHTIENCSKVGLISVKTSLKSQQILVLNFCNVLPNGNKYTFVIEKKKKGNIWTPVQQLMEKKPFSYKISRYFEYS